MKRAKSPSSPKIAQHETVRVAVRLRPPTSAASTSSVTKGRLLLHRTSRQVEVRGGVQKSSRPSSNLYKFDHVYGPKAKQSDVFRCCEGLVKSVVKGYNATIFAYGQSGSGKTFSFDGASAACLDTLAELKNGKERKELSSQDVSSESDGVIPRAADLIFRTIHRRSQARSLSESESKGGNGDVGSSRASGMYLVRCSFVELYGETVFDLLHPEYPEQASGLVLREKGSQKDGTGGPGAGFVCEGCQEVLCSEPEDIKQLLEMGRGRRRQRATWLNKRSSRSHAVFTILVESTTALPPSDGSAEGAHIVKQGRLTLVDLAGSEQLFQRAGGNSSSELSHVDPDATQVQESGRINKSLLALRRVIKAVVAQQKALAEASGGAVLSRAGSKSESKSDGGRTPKGGFVPYRESKLTMILKSALGGGSRCLVLCTVRSESEFLRDSERTLRFAQQLKYIRNTPVVRVNPQYAQISDLQAQVAYLKRLLAKQGIDVGELLEGGYAALSPMNSPMASPLNIPPIPSLSLDPFGSSKPGYDVNFRTPQPRTRRRSHTVTTSAFQKGASSVFTFEQSQPKVRRTRKYSVIGGSSEDAERHNDFLVKLLLGRLKEATGSRTTPQAGKPRRKSSGSKRQSRTHFSRRAPKSEVSQEAKDRAKGDFSTPVSKGSAAVNVYESAALISEYQNLNRVLLGRKPGDAKSANDDSLMLSSPPEFAHSKEDAFGSTPLPTNLSSETTAQPSSSKNNARPSSSKSTARPSSSSSKRRQPRKTPSSRRTISRDTTPKSRSVSISSRPAQTGSRVRSPGHPEPVPSSPVPGSSQRRLRSRSRTRQRARSTLHSRNKSESSKSKPSKPVVSSTEQRASASQSGSQRVGRLSRRARNGLSQRKQTSRGDAAVEKQLPTKQISRQTKRAAPPVVVAPSPSIPASKFNGGVVFFSGEPPPQFRSRVSALLREMNSMQESGVTEADMRASRSGSGLASKVESPSNVYQLTLLQRKEAARRKFLELVKRKSPPEQGVRMPLSYMPLPAAADDNNVKPIVNVESSGETNGNSRLAHPVATNLSSDSESNDEEEMKRISSSVESARQIPEVVSSETPEPSTGEDEGIVISDDITRTLGSLSRHDRQAFLTLMLKTAVHTCGYGQGPPVPEDARRKCRRCVLMQMRGPVSSARRSPALTAPLSGNPTPSKDFDAAAEDRPKRAVNARRQKSLDYAERVRRQLLDRSRQQARRKRRTPKSKSMSAAASPTQRSPADDLSSLFVPEVATKPRSRPSVRVTRVKKRGKKRRIRGKRKVKRKTKSLSQDATMSVSGPPVASPNADTLVAIGEPLSDVSEGDPPSFPPSPATPAVYPAENVGMSPVSDVGQAHHEAFGLVLQEIEVREKTVSLDNVASSNVENEIVPDESTRNVVEVDATIGSGSSGSSNDTDVSRDVVDASNIDNEAGSDGGDAVDDENDANNEVKDASTAAGEDDNSLDDDVSKNDQDASNDGNEAADGADVGEDDGGIDPTVDTHAQSDRSSPFTPASREVDELAHANLLADRIADKVALIIADRMAQQSASFSSPPTRSVPLPVEIEQTATSVVDAGIAQNEQPTDLASREDAAGAQPLASPDVGRSESEIEDPVKESPEIQTQSETEGHSASEGEGEVAIESEGEVAIESEGEGAVESDGHQAEPEEGRGSESDGGYDNGNEGLVSDTPVDGESPLNSPQARTHIPFPSARVTATPATLQTSERPFSGDDGDNSLAELAASAELAESTALDDSRVASGRYTGTITGYPPIAAEELPRTRVPVPVSAPDGVRKPRAVSSYFARLAQRKQKKAVTPGPASTSVPRSTPKAVSYHDAAHASHYSPSPVHDGFYLVVTEGAEDAAGDGDSDSDDAISSASDGPSAELETSPPHPREASHMSGREALVTVSNRTVTVPPSYNVPGPELASKSTQLSIVRHRQPSSGSVPLVARELNELVGSEGAVVLAEVLGAIREAKGLPAKDRSQGSMLNSGPIGSPVPTRLSLRGSPHTPAEAHNTQRGTVSRIELRDLVTALADELAPRCPNCNRRHSTQPASSPSAHGNECAYDGKPYIDRTQRYYHQRTRRFHVSKSIKSRSRSGRGLASADTSVVTMRSPRAVRPAHPKTPASSNGIQSGIAVVTYVRRGGMGSAVTETPTASQGGVVSKKVLDVDFSPSYRRPVRMCERSWAHRQLHRFLNDQDQTREHTSTGQAPVSGVGRPLEQHWGSTVRYRSPEDEVVRQHVLSKDTKQ